MNTRILTLVTASALLLGTGSQAWATPQDSTKNVSTEQRIENSAKQFAAESIELASEAVKQAQKSSSELKANIDKRLDDTIINGKEIKQLRHSDEYMEYRNNRFNQERYMMEESFELAKYLGEGFAIFAIFITIIIVIGVYLNRHQKYKIIEKAIENNYPLPPGFLGKNLRPTTTTVQHIHYTQEQAKTGKIQAGVTKVTKEFNVTDWANFRSGIKWCAWGLAFFIFFLWEEASAAAFALIPIIIGASKLYTAYQLQLSEKKAKIQTEKADNDTATPTPPFTVENEDK